MVKKHDLVSAIMSTIQEGFSDMVITEAERVSNSIIDVHVTDYTMSKEPAESDFRLYIADMSYESPMDIVKQDIDRQLLHEWLQYFKNNPDRFIERFFGVRLTWYQRLLIKLSRWREQKR